MKANWKIVLMCVATLAFVACKDKNGADEDSGDVEYSAKIDVHDQSVAEWDSLDASKVFVAKISEKPLWGGVHLLKVYADEVYINWMMVFDPALYAKHREVDVMHVFLDLDHSPKTGGFFDLFADASVDMMLEGALYDGAGNPIDYAPTVHNWVGPESGEPKDRVGEWESVWKAAGNMVGESQFVGDSIVEARIMIENIPGKEKFAEEGFGFGATMTQNFHQEAVGYLPQGNSPDGEFVGRVNMLYVKFTKTMK